MVNGRRSLVDEIVVHPHMGAGAPLKHTGLQGHGVAGILRGMGSVAASFMCLPHAPQCAWLLRSKGRSSRGGVTGEIWQ